MADYEVGIYNAEVRERVEAGHRHRSLTDDWAEIHYIEVSAADIAGARLKVLRRYPEKRGFIIDSVEKKYSRPKITSKSVHFVANPIDSTLY
jgi:hypothetical protein